MNIVIIPKTIFNRFIAFITILLFVDLVGLFSKYYFHYDYYLIPLLDFNTERNIPTFYSACALIFGAILLFFISWLHKRSNRSYLMWVGI